ncbi:cation-translocating P-type ATPase [Pseudomonas aeruginosa]|jgi:heavy metal translocating P-type ATPase|uniref:heavy metal translocating P-type ATPase n=2 Tax=Pseudomonas aeruginosa TaxID=287 RepID=UPI000D21C94B|nr:cation-translocating P-type ATPase [Pseudomonas aeruginosa]AVZ19395.1 cation-translocating P-type ATPase [Pseudomonas aeruginosa]MCV3807413.1 cation-translocating P-type ATPase [Pseudomonas aeruginosa]MCV3879176.1 cation-translocating P-type ATPase [Pseudomonas aeruginosa]MCV3935407.1 cation-translocating P-type ATPase [Pseudomonas aeruginosa]MCV3941734.1 cation-translocating P-type ATPase [Pseudomonas aeruginosa]
MSRAGRSSGADFDYEQARVAGRMVFSVDGLWCVSCAMALQRVLQRVPGVVSATVNFTSGSALVTWVPESIDFPLLLRKAEGLGYALSPLKGSDELEAALQRQARKIRLQLTVAVVFGMWSMLGSWVLYLNADEAAALVIAWASVVASLPVVGYSAWDFYRAAARSLRAGIAGMDVFASVAVLGSLFVSVGSLAMGSVAIYTDAATMLITFLLIGRLIEIHARQESGLAVQALRSLAPETATKLTSAGGEKAESTVLLAELAPGDTVLIRANERIAVDGIVVAGQSAVDLSLLQGESAPRSVQPGERVFAGSVNLRGPLTVHVTAGAGDRRLDVLGLRMLELFGARSSLSETAERFVRILLPVVVTASLLAFVHYLWNGSSADQALLGALSLLVAACPCAVGLAMPLAYAFTCREAARRGVLLRDSASVEALARARIMAFDKTGTLTCGQMRIVSIQTRHGGAEQDLIDLAARAEAGVAHPIAHAVVLAARQSGMSSACEPDGCQVTACAKGVTMQVPGGEAVRVGERNWLLAAGVEGMPPEDGMPGLVHVAKGRDWLGSLRLQDAPRDDARSSLQQLRAQGLKLWLLTGDSSAASDRLTADLGIDFDRVETHCSPEEKADIVAKSPAPVAFVGDGANDGLVLAQAACGIAIPGSSSVAVSAAGVVIAHGSVGAVVETRELARKFDRIVRQNLGFSVAYNLAVIVVLFEAGVTPFAAALAMLASSASVFLNTCRLLQGRPVLDRSMQADPATS